MDKAKKESIKNRIKNFCKKIWEECKDRKTLTIFFIVVIVVYAPVWLDYILYFIFKYKLFLVIATACLAFWAGPGTPFFPLCIAITLAIKKMIKRRERKKSEREAEAEHVENAKIEKEDLEYEAVICEHAENVDAECEAAEDIYD